ncbi:MAG: RNA 2',3'-cyclic phosphodiesterase [Chloroflexi bacterium]|nr:RNA 2',3'-cyclic phosphodiesterase [Chloroflexota bacterium]
MEMIRAFIAVELPGEVKADLVGIQDSLRRNGKGLARWVSVEAMHLTLKFLGDVSSDLLPQVSGVTKGAAAGTLPFRLKTDGLGMFPDSRSPRVLWIGLTGDTQVLVDLQARIEEALVPLGFAKEDRPFTPHLTLCRLQNAPPRERREFGEQVLQLKAPPPREFSVAGLNIMRSTLTPAGAVYARLAEIQFGKVS